MCVNKNKFYLVYAFNCLLLSLMETKKTKKSVLNLLFKYIFWKAVTTHDYHGQTNSIMISVENWK